MAVEVYGFSEGDDEMDVKSVSSADTYSHAVQPRERRAMERGGNSL